MGLDIENNMVCHSWPEEQHPVAASILFLLPCEHATLMLDMKEAVCVTWVAKTLVSVCGHFHYIPVTNKAEFRNI